MTQKFFFLDFQISHHFCFSILRICQFVDVLYWNFLSCIGCVLVVFCISSEVVSPLIVILPLFHRFLIIRVLLMNDNDLLYFQGET